MIDPSKIEQTLLCFDVMVNGNLYSHQETTLKLVRVGKMPGLELAIEDPRLDPIHFVFHLMTRRVMLDIVTTEPVTFFRAGGVIPEILAHTTIEIGNGDSIIVNDTIAIHNCYVDVTQGRIGASTVTKAIEKDIVQTMAQMGIVYGSVKELTPEQLIIHALVTKLCTFAQGISRTTQQLSNISQQALLRVQHTFNGMNVLSEMFRQHAELIHSVVSRLMLVRGKEFHPLWTDMPSYQKFMEKVMQELLEASKPGNEPPTSPTEVVEAKILQMQRQHLPE